jgi:multidrug resistance efflux pump
MEGQGPRDVKTTAEGPSRDSAATNTPGAPGSQSARGAHETPSRGAAAGSDETATSVAADDAASPARRDPTRLVTLIVLALAALVFVWYVLADRHTPFTDQARIEALVVPIVPRVSGYVAELNVRLHSVVDEGDQLLRIDPEPFQLAVESAQAALDDALQQVGAQSAGVEAAVAQLGVAEAQLDRSQRNFDRVQAIQAENPGALSQADRDRTETSLTQAQERVAAAAANLEAARAQLGVEGEGNPRVRSAIAALERAELDLAFTTLYAPARGAIENFTIDVGHYAGAGQPVGTFITVSDVWIQADLRENNLANIQVGDPVEVVLDVAPAQVFQATVRSVGFGVSAGMSGSRGELEQVSGSSGWLRDPQRFPVIITFDGDEALGLRRVGGQADVVVYTGSRPILNAVARLRLRLVGWLSYVR